MNKKENDNNISIPRYTEKPSPKGGGKLTFKFPNTRKMSSLKIDLHRPPRRRSEAEIQAELWCTLLEYGMNARLEVPQYDSPKMRSGDRSARFDIVIYRKNLIPIIIEVKKKKPRKPVKELSQFKRYSKYNAELLFCCGEKEIKKTLNSVLDLCKGKKEL
jgi:hypothetical protein